MPTARRPFRLAFYLILVTCVQLTLAIINPYNYYQLRTDTIFAYLLFSCFSALVIARVSIPNIPISRNRVIPTSPKAKKARLIALFYISPSILVFILLMLFTLRSGISIQQLRDLFFFGDGTSLPFLFGDIFIYLALYIGFGYYLFISLVARYKLGKDKDDRDAAILTAAALFFLDTATGGRMAVFYLSLILASFYILIPSSESKIFKGKKIKFASLLIISVFVVITNLRLRGDSVNFLEFLYKYMVGPIFLMDQGLIDSQGLLFNQDVRTGMSAMSFDWIIAGILKSAGVEIRTLFDITNYELSVGYYLNDKYGINAHFTSAFYFILDYGYMAGPFLLMYATAITWLGSIKHNAQRQLSIAIYLSFGMLLGIRENIFNMPAFLFTLVLLMTFPLTSHTQQIRAKHGLHTPRRRVI